MIADVLTARARRAAAQRRYRVSAKGRIADVRYAHSLRGKSRYIRYRATERGHLLRRLNDTRPDVLLKKRLYQQSYQEAQC